MMCPTDVPRSANYYSRVSDLILIATGLHRLHRFVGSAVVVGDQIVREAIQ